MRVLKVMPFFHPDSHMGGPVRQAHEVCSRLVERGNVVRVISSDLGVPEEVSRNRWIHWSGMEVWYSRTRSWNRVPPYWLPGARAPLAEVIGDSDVVCANVGLTLLNAAAFAISRKNRVPFVYNAEGALCPDRLAIRRWSKRGFLRLFERRILGGAAALQAVTAREAGDLVAQGACPDRVHVIPNGVAPGRDGDGRAFRERTGLSQDALVVLFLGRLHPIKGIDLLLRAALGVMHRHPEVELVVAGPDQGCAESVRRQASSAGMDRRVHITGAVDFTATADALAAADVFALTSFTEGLPNAVLEAAAAGLPLLVTDRCNLPEVGEFDAGIMAPPDVEALERGLERLIEDPGLRQRCGANARTMVAERFSMEAVVTRLEDLYRQVAGQ